MNYSKIQPINVAIPADRQSAKRHYGVHPYFTRRPYNVVRDYILHYSKETDRVLDPFGGSGVTAIEAYLENRVGIQNDINPLANFIAKGIKDLENGNLEDYFKAIVYLREKCESKISEVHESDESKLKKILIRVSLPENIHLPKNSDVSHYHELFSLKQLLSLAIIKDEIDSLENKHAKKGMLLAWSATLSKLNKTFLSANGRAESRGGSSIFSIYRYKVAKEPVELPIWQTFVERAENVIKAKKEIDKAIEFKKQQKSGWCGKFEVYSRDIEELSSTLKESVDYIFTDPPYGGHISYLDLSTLWNNWLGLLPSINVRETELIVGGDLNFSESQYVNKLGKSVRACLKMLKRGRWFSIVFQHWNVAYFEAILSSASVSGAELRTAVSQVGDPIWSMHKKKNSSVLAGELILTFFKTGKVYQNKKNGVFDVAQFLRQLLNETKDKKVYGEYLFNKVVIEAWKQSSIQSLTLSKDDFINLIEEQGWHYDEQNHYWIKNGQESNTLLWQL
jgi:DNA modification methylase